MKKNIIKYIIIFSLIISAVFISKSVMNNFAVALNTPTIQVTYSLGNLTTDGSDTSDRVEQEEYDEDFLSVKLHEFNSDFDVWGKGNIVSNDITYEAAFAGWKLTSINGTAYEGNYFYPEHENIYFNDEPFASYGEEITSLGFEALWGKNIYLRDKYNFNDITKVYADTDTALFDLDTSVSYAKSLTEDPTAGNSSTNPVDNLTDALSLLGADGGKITIVNHYVLAASEDRYPYHPNFKHSTSATTYFDIGKSITNGTLTISSKGFGRVDGDETEKANESNTTNYSNGYLYLKNTQGLGTYNGKAYKGLAYYVRYYCHTVYENINITGYREHYYNGNSRYTYNVYFDTAANTRFVMKNTTKIFKRTTSASDESITGIWAHSPKNKKSAFQAGGHGYLDLRAGANGSCDSTSNLYLTVYGNMSTGNSLYSVYVKPAVSSGVHKYINNVHINLIKARVGTFYGISTSVTSSYSITLNDYHVKLFDCVISQSSTTYNSYSTTIDNVKYIIDGDSASASYKLTTLFIGAYGNTPSSHQITTHINKADVVVRGKAYISSLYGGSNEISAKTYFDDLSFDIRSGYIGGLYGGGLGGPTNATKISMNISGGTIGNVYGGGAGGVSSVYNSNSPFNATDYTHTDDYKYFIYSSSVAYVGKHYELQKYAFNWDDGSSNEYDVITFEYLYPQETIEQLSGYYRTTQAVCVSEAMVEVSDSIEINISGNAKITNSVYGGGENGAVTGNIKINYSSGTIGGDIFGGGKGSATSYSAIGTFASSVDVDFRFVSNQNGLNSSKAIEILDDDYNNSKSTSYSTAKTFASSLSSKYKTAYKFNSNDFANLNLISGSNDKGLPIVEVYSANIVQLGLINGDIEINVSNNGIKGNIYGGSDGVIASITGNSVINVNNTDLSDNTIYGGGNIAYVGGNTTVNLTSSSVNEVYAGGNEGDVKGNSNIKLDNATIVTNIYGGGNHGTTEGSIEVEVLNNSTIDSLYGGANQADVNKDISIDVKDSKIENFYGANNQSGNIVGNVSSTLSNSEITNIYGGGNYADFENTVSLTVSNVESSYLFGGGNFAKVGSIDVSINGGTYDYVYGGGNEGITNGNVNLTIDNATSIDVYGGANKADINGNVTFNANNLSAVNYYGANNVTGVISGVVSSTLIDSNITYIYGGGNQAEFKNAVTLKATNTNADNLFGGGNFAEVGSVEVIIIGGEIDYIYGGGNEGDTTNSVSLTIENSNAIEIYGGANNANIGENVTFIATNVSASDIFGANNIGGEITGNVSSTITDSEISNCIYGGGNKASLNNTASLTLNNCNVNSVYGGGKEASVGSTDVIVSSGNILNSLFSGGDEGEVISTSNLLINNNAVINNVYGGGKNASVNDTTIVINSANISNNIYGGGFAGTSNNTSLTIDDSNNLGEIIIGGNVFGGGEGTSATVYNSTSVIINLNYSFDVIEKQITTNQETPSGASDVKVIATLTNYSYISGNVYGGGDLAQVGQGNIVLSSNTASNIIPGTTNVTIYNGLIKGSVFGGGNGVPKDTSYNIYMGTVFGNTTVNIYGGHIESNVYGGGTQSRLYYGSKTRTASNAATVNINETQPNSYQKIVIGGSVFGGGDRGSGASHNASVPTTIGNVSVNITGKDNSQIFFVHGGVYGDGNYCLVSGERTINILDFNTGNDEYLKTFYSLQRADYVNLTNSKIVLLGAVDLVEEGDNTIYSINRIEDLSMNSGSTIKLDQIVKCLEYISSDVNTSHIYIDKGNNGENNFTDFGGSSPLNQLTDDQIYEYQQSTTIEKNVICVANGLFFELKYEDESGEDRYGYLQGLFTLQLLHANPGEGGGFVYADIINSKGTFICETVREEKYVEANNVTAENVSLYYELVDGNYVQATSYDENTVYYKVNYMNIIDDVSAFVNGSPTRYCWYIDGTTINYSTSLTGHIGSTQTLYSTDLIIPRHDVELYYALNIVRGNELLDKVANNSTYNFKSSSDSLSGQDIAIEFKIGESSLGFLTYEKVDEQIVWKINNLEGFNDHGGLVANNFLTDSMIVDKNNEVFNIVLHKSTDVDTETIGMQIELSLVLYNKINDDYLKYNGGTSNLNFYINLNIQRLVPTQSSFSAAGKYYSGVAVNEVINITGNSSFTMQYQTRYIPDAFPDDEKEIFWALSTKSYTYYMDINGNSMTFEGNNLKFISDGLIFDGNLAGSVFTQETVYLDEDGNYFYIDGNNNPIYFTKTYSSSLSYIPKNTKITMVDKSLINNQFYYYYICKEDETLINVEDFMFMGSTTKIKDSASKPYFMTSYINGGAARITEEIIFIFDFSNVEYETTSSFSGEVSFAHLYGENIETAIDIMDYVKIDIDSLGNKNYSRFHPVSTNFVLNPASDGIDNFEVNNDNNVYGYDEIDFSINIDHSQDIINSASKDHEYSLKIELINSETNESILLPHGSYVLYENNKYYATYDDKYIIIPIKTNGTHDFSFVNNLISFNDIISDKFDIKLTLYLCSDSSYYNEVVNYVNKEHIVTINLHQNPVYSLDVKLNDTIVSLNETVSFTINSSITGEEVVGVENVKVKVYYKDSESNTYKESSVLLSTLKYDSETGVYSLTINEKVSKGTYRLIISYGDKQVVKNFIVK